MREQSRRVNLAICGKSHCSAFWRKLEFNEAIRREVGYNQNVLCNLTKEQRDILVGLLLGDGNLEFDGYKGTRLQVKQSEARKEYVWWLYSHFAHMTKTPPQRRKDTGQWYFGTRFYEDLEDMRKLFYHNTTEGKLCPHQ
jgi:hypothetical protein